MNGAALSNEFYSRLESFADFQLLSRDEIYRSVPEDWFVVIADVEGSTREVAAGRYEVVNTVGAGAIVIVQSLFGKDLMAFVFGGDGATFLIPPNRIAAVRSILSNYKKFCASQFAMNLRVGVVPVTDIIGAGQKIEAAKFTGAGGVSTVFLRGGGITWAERAVKAEAGKYRLEAGRDDVAMPLKALSCRWNPIRSSRGKILTLLVQPRTFEGTKVFDGILAELRSILGGSLEGSNPVQTAQLRYRGLWTTIRKELPLSGGIFSSSWAKRLCEILISQWAFRLGLPVPFAAGKYVDQLSKHSDYRKYDDMLRLVLDCDTNQIKQIEKCLNSFYERGEIYFGTFQSSHAVMTCILENLGEGGHIHLIDGSDGGYTMAAKQLVLQRQLL